jgi:hypothetical protein
MGFRLIHVIYDDGAHLGVGMLRNRSVAVVGGDEVMQLFSDLVRRHWQGITSCYEGLGGNMGPGLQLKLMPASDAVLMSTLAAAEACRFQDAKHCWRDGGAPQSTQYDQKCNRNLRAGEICKFCSYVKQLSRPEPSKCIHAHRSKTIISTELCYNPVANKISAFTSIITQIDHHFQCILLQLSGAKSLHRSCLCVWESFQT